MAIILVEDHEDLRNEIASLLRDEGFDVIALECSEDIDDTPEALSADTYIIDLNLPGEDGISLVKRIRAAEPNANIFIMTARSGINQRIEGYEAGADIYLPKPIDPAELVAILSSRAKRNCPEEQTFFLKLEKQTVSGAQEAITLSLAETQLIAAWSKAKGHLLEQWQLMNLLTSENKDMSLDTLHQRLSRLRRKFQTAGIEGDIIKSERGFGYKLLLRIKILK